MVRCMTMEIDVHKESGYRLKELDTNGSVKKYKNKNERKDEIS